MADNLAEFTGTLYSHDYQPKQTELTRLLEKVGCGSHFTPDDLRRYHEFPNSTEIFPSEKSDTDRALSTGYEIIPNKSGGYSVNLIRCSGINPEDRLYKEQSNTKPEILSIVGNNLFSPDVKNLKKLLSDCDFSVVKSVGIDGKTDYIGWINPPDKDR